MKSKISRGSGFLGTLNYVLDQGKKATGDKLAEVVSGNMSSEDAKRLSKEFQVSRLLRPEVKNPVWHCSLSLPKGERLDKAQWDRVIRRYMEKMGIDVDNHQYIAARHSDTEYDHIHIVMSRIGLNSELWHGRNDVKQSIKATQILEKEFGLTITAGYDELTKSGKRRPKSKEIEMANRTGEVPARMALQNIIDEATTDHIDVFAFIERVESAGAHVIPNVAKSGKLNGFSFAYQGIKFKGSDLGDDYKWGKKPSKLKEKVKYEQEQDGRRLVAEASRIKQAVDEIDQAKSEASPAVSAGAGECPEANRPDSQQPSAIEQPEQKYQQGTPESGEYGNNGVGRQHGELEKSSPRSDEPNREDEQGNRSNLYENQEPVLSVRSPDWGALDNIVDGLAAPVNQGNVSGQQSDSPDQRRKVEAWRKQHSALNAPQYRITLMPRKGGKPWVLGKSDSGERFYSAKEVESKIPLLRQKNTQGRDIYITPIDSNNHYIVIDDLTNDKYKELRAAGYNPTLVQESSKDNIQAIIKVPKLNDKDEQSLANKVVVGINQKYGDPKFSGVVHPFRMAGFSNKKAGRNNAFTRILSTSKEACQRTMQLLKQELNKVLESRKAKVEREREVAIKLDVQARLNRIKTAPQFANNIDTVFQKNWSKHQGLAIRNNWEIDFSRIDFNVTKDLLIKGFKESDVEQALLNCSPEIATRKHNPDDYVKRTVAKARSELGDKLNKKPDNEPEIKKPKGYKPPSFK